MKPVVATAAASRPDESRLAKSNRTRPLFLAASVVCAGLAVVVGVDSQNSKEQRHEVAFRAAAEGLAVRPGEEIEAARRICEDQANGRTGDQLVLRVKQYSDSATATEIGLFLSLTEAFCREEMAAG